MKLEGGAIRLGSQRLGLDPAARPRPEGHRLADIRDRRNPPSFEPPFVVQGRWDDPIMLPDAQSLIRRSGAAAPLLDAVRDRKTRDAVRNMIDRLNRDEAPAAAPVAAPAAAKP